MIEKFIFFGLLGWTLEILWTGFQAVLHGDATMQGHTSLWMFPIYGLAAFLEPIARMILILPWGLRGGIYMVCIFAVEYASGWGICKAIGQCPWDYTGMPSNIHGLIRLDYAPLWFLVGILFERVTLLMPF